VPHWSHLIPESIWGPCPTVIFHMTDLPYGRGGSPLQNLIQRGHSSTMLTALRCGSGAAPAAQGPGPRGGGDASLHPLWHHHPVRHLGRGHRCGDDPVQVHLIGDNYCKHKHAKVRTWLAPRPPSSFTTPPLRLLAQSGGALVGIITQRNSCVGIHGHTTNRW
jgi:hypothetical protein